MIAFILLIVMNTWCPDVISDSTFTLNVIAVNAASDDGTVRTQLFDHNKTMVLRTNASIENNQAEISFAELCAGHYAVRLYHDENDNQLLDTNVVGIPRERYGFSNNVRGWMGEPSFDRQLFRIESDTTITIKLE